MVGLSFKNFLLRIVTLGIYHFWGKTEVRKRIWSAIRINGEPLQYTGTGKEMFLGFLFVLGVVTRAAAAPDDRSASSLVFGPSRPRSAFQVRALRRLFFYLIGVGMHRAIRYRMSRTIWRGIRGGLEGSAWRYGWTYFWTGILLIADAWLGLAVARDKLQGLITNDMRFGNRPFHSTRRPARSMARSPRCGSARSRSSMLIGLASG